MATTIQFTLYIESTDGDYSKFEARRKVQSTESIRAHSISVIQEAIEHGVKSWTTDVSDDNAIQLYLAEDDVQNPTEGYNKHGFGIKYAINKDQSIRILNNYEPLHADWTLSEIQELVNANYIKGDQRHIIIGVPCGLGAGGGPMPFEWAGFLIALSAPVKLGWKHALRTVNLIDRRKIQKIAREWKNNGILYPSTLREFIDVKAEWRLPEVKQRLKLSDEYAIKLLTSLGFEPKGDGWRLTHSKASIENRSKWLTLEKKYYGEHSSVPGGEYVAVNENARLAITVALLTTIIAFLALVNNPVFNPIKIILIASGLLQFLFLVFSAERLRFNFTRSVVRFFDNPFSLDKWCKRCYDWSIQVYLLAFVGLGFLMILEYTHFSVTGASKYLRDLQQTIIDIDQSGIGLSSLIVAALLLLTAYVVAWLLRIIIIGWRRLWRGRE